MTHARACATLKARLAVIAAFSLTVSLHFTNGPSRAYADEDDEAAVPSPTYVTHADDGTTRIKLDAAARKNLALATATPRPAEVTPEVDGYGRVLDPQSLIEMSAEQAKARATVDGASKELARVRLLAKDQNASVRALEAAETALRLAEISLATAHATLQSAWGTELAGRDDLADFAGRLATRKAVVVRVDVPTGRNLNPVGVTLVTLDEPPRTLSADLIGRAPNVDPQLQGASFLALVASEEASLVPGQALTGLLAVSGHPISGVVIPTSAVVRSDGRSWVYVEVADDEFERRPVVLDRPMPDGWFVTSGLDARDRVVVTGAQMLLSEELKSAVQEAD